MLDVNQIAPDFTLPGLDQHDVHFYQSARGDSVLVFYKHTCGTSTFTLPFLQKIYEAYGDAIFFAAIAQDDPEATRRLRDELGLSMPLLLDQSPYVVGGEYGLHTVPSIFLINKNRKILFASYGFVKQDILNLADTIAERTGRPQIEPFGDVDVPAIKPG